MNATAKAAIEVINFIGSLPIIRCVTDPSANKNPPSIAMAGQAEWALPQIRGKRFYLSAMFVMCPGLFA
jgi:hypothetical protein